MVVPEINPEHFDVIESQKKRLEQHADLSLLNQTALSRVMLLY